MKRYSHFLRSGATVSLSILYLATSLFSYTFVGAQEVSQNVQSIDESSSVVETSEISLEESEVIFSEQVDPHEKTISEQTEEIFIEEVVEEIFVEAITQTEEETKVEEISAEVLAPEVFACDETNTPEISFAKTYADTHVSDVSMESSILSQLNPIATDPQDGTLTVSNDLVMSTLTAGWNEITFSVTDSTGCVTTSVISVFVVGDDFAPVCQSGFVYAKITFPETLTASLGTNTSVQSGEWFPVMVDGSTFSESESNITTNPDIAITRVGTTLFVNVAPGVVNASELADSIANSVDFSGGSVVSAMAFSGDVALIDFQAEECPVDVCTAFGGPSIVSITSTVTIDENTTLTEEEIFALFEIFAEDLDGEGLVSITSNLSSVSFQNEGVYTITITLTDNEGCVSSQTVTLVALGEDDNGGGGGGSRRSGSRQEKPEGEVLGATTCEPYLTTYMQMGEANLKSDVEKLQIFLNEYMGENLKVDGIYGQATFDAVKRFQTQEFDEILKPWGITEATGITRETTVRRINNIMCPELNIQMPILYCATTGNLIYPDGTIIDPNPEYILYNGKSVIRKQVITPEVLSETSAQEPQDNYSWTPAPVINPETGRKYEK